MNTPLQLEQYFFPKVAVTANPQFDPNKPVEISEPKLDVMVRRHQSDANRFAVEVRLRLPSTAEENCPYSVELEAFAAVKSTGEVPGNLIENVIAHNSAHLLYGASREMIALITGRGPFAPLFLPARTIDLQKSVPAKTSETETGKAVSANRS